MSDNIKNQEKNFQASRIIFIVFFIPHSLALRFCHSTKRVFSLGVINFDTSPTLPDNYFLYFATLTRQFRMIPALIRIQILSENKLEPLIYRLTSRRSFCIASEIGVLNTTVQGFRFPDIMLAVS